MEIDATRHPPNTNHSTRVDGRPFCDDPKNCKCECGPCTEGRSAEQADCGRPLKAPIILGGKPGILWGPMPEEEFRKNHPELEDDA